MAVREKDFGYLWLALAASAAAAAGAPSPMQAQETLPDRARLEAVLSELERGEVPLDELMSIPTAEESRELHSVVEDLVRFRSEVRELRERYVDEYPLIQERLTTIAIIETKAIPRVVEGLIASLPGSDKSGGLGL